MAIATTEPNYFTAGNNVYWNKTLSDYPASSYLLSYKIVPIAGGEAYSFAASASGSVHQVRLTPANTAGYTAGDYLLIGTVTDLSTSGLTTKISLESTRLEIKPQPESTLDRRSFAQITLLALQDTYTKLAKSSINSGTVNGKTYTRSSLSELRSEITYWQSQINAENGGAVKHIAVKFITPS
jgi:hypothetical protein